MQRYNLWVIDTDGSKIICHGERGEMNDIAILAGIPGEVHVLPDTEEPNHPAAS
jgi:hypothetical protein